MKKVPAMLIPEDIINIKYSTSYNNGNGYVYSRPIGMQDWKLRFKYAWMVFKGDLDVIRWPQGQ